MIMVILDKTIWNIICINKYLEILIKINEKLIK